MTTHKRLFASAGMFTVLACAAGGAFAQDAAPSGQAEAEEEKREVIEVRGIRGALDLALATKRNADTIGEAISADDLGTLPALDLAEALQVVPGVQVNRENDDGAFRYGEISLRGLPGSFTNTTANGQSFASPSGSVTPAEGVPNAFGAFPSSVFDGVWVNKTSRADLVEGGIAGTVDQRLAQALSKPDGQFVVRVGGQYEELPDEIVPTFFATGTKHLIEDRLGVTFKFSHEEETFRRDAFNFTTYSPLRTDGTRNRGGFVGADGETLDEWRTANGIAAEDTVLYASNFRQYSEGRDGFRTAFVGGAEFQATEALKLGADILYSNRELDFDAKWILPSPGGISTSITPTSDPFAAFVNDDGNTTWVLPGYDYEDITYSQSSRGGNLVQESQGIFLDAEYVKDRWTIDGSLAFSTAEFARIGGNFQAQYLSNTANDFGTNGTFGSINSGSGNSDDYVFTLNFDPAITTVGTDLDLAYPRTDNTAANFIQLASPVGRQRFFSAGNEVFRDRSDNAININAERELDFGPLTSVKFGGRYNEQSVDSRILLYSIAGLNTEGLSNDLFVPGPSASNFFGGGAPGALTDGEWEFLDYEVLEALLFDGFENPNNARTTPFPPGYIYRTDSAGNLLRQNEEATTDTTISALYAMANYEGELGRFEVAGNFGVRYVETELDGEGFGTINGEVTEVTASNSYTNVLPAFNGSIKLTPDLYLRLGYSEALNRPNPAGFTPAISINELDGQDGDLGRVDVVLPGTEVEAYTSNNYDAALEWYNRAGSLVSLALYRKDVNSFIDTRLVCPEDGADLGFGTLSEVDLGGIVECRIDADGREIRITETYNFDSTITIDGVEISVQQNLDFLDHWFLRGFGVQASAAFVDVSGEDSQGNEARVPRISDSSYNLAGYWENDQFSARLAYNWRSDYFLQGGLSITGAEDRQVAPRGQLDFITRYDITDDFTVDFRAFNILEVEYEEYQSGNEAMVRQTAYDGRTFVLSGTKRF